LTRFLNLIRGLEDIGSLIMRFLLKRRSLSGIGDINVIRIFCSYMVVGGGEYGFDGEIPPEIT